MKHFTNECQMVFLVAATKSFELIKGQLWSFLDLRFSRSRIEPQKLKLYLYENVLGNFKLIVVMFDACNIEKRFMVNRN